MTYFLTPTIANKRGVSTKPKRRSKARVKKSASISKLRLMATVVIVILFSLGLYALNQLGSSKIQHSKPASANKPLQVEEKSTTKEDDYSFYGKLKDFEVVVSEDSAYNSSRSVDDNYIYLIQAGSFKTQAQAEKLLVELTLLGLEPKIDKSRNASGNLWYRVRLGPFENRGTMTAVRSTIISNDLEAMVMKRKI